MSDDGFWWKKGEGKTHEKVFTYVRALEEAQKDRALLNVKLARLYSNRDLFGIGWSLKSFGGRPSSDVPRNSDNIIKSVCDSAAALISKNRPKPTIVTDGAEWSMQRRAKLLEKFLVGQFQRTKIYRKAQAVFLDAVVFGTGALKIYDDGDGNIQVERRIIDEVIADELECGTSCEPRQIHQRCFVDREVLRASYPDAARAIDDAHRATGGAWSSFRQVESYQVAVVESWRLPSRPGAGDGLHTICVETETLLEEPWEKDAFPWVFFRWSPPLTGFYGIGLAELLAGKQLRINKLHKFIDDCQDLTSNPRTFVEHSSKVLEAKFTNRIGEVIGYRGRPPIFMTAQAVHPEIYQRLETLKASGFEEAGISRLSAQSKKPAGIDSAVGLREYNDIETQRFAIPAQEYEQLHLEAGRQMIGLAKEAAGRKKKVEAVFQSRSLIRRIDWSEVDMDEDLYSMGIEASSLLTRSPAGRSSTVLDWLEAGLVQADEARRLLGHPDLERSQSLGNAAIEDAERVIEELLDGGYTPPEPFQNLALCLDRVQMAYLKARGDGAPEDLLQGMRDWMEQAQHLLSPPAPPAPPAGPPGLGASPPAAPIPGAPAGQPMPMPPMAAAGAA